MAIGKRKKSRIRALRVGLGLTRDRAAVMAGISSSSLYLAEAFGHITPATAAKLAPVLRVAPEDLTRERP